MAGITDSFLALIDRGDKQIVCLRCKTLFQYRNLLMDNEDVSMTEIRTHAAFSHPSDSTFAFQNIKTYTNSKKSAKLYSPVDTKIRCGKLKDVINHGFKIAFNDNAVIFL